MTKAPPKKLYRVELFIEVPDKVTPPTAWDWDTLVNGPNSKKAGTLSRGNRTPVTFVLAQETVEGTA